MPTSLLSGEAKVNKYNTVTSLFHVLYFLCLTLLIAFDPFTKVKMKNKYIKTDYSLPIKGGRWRYQVLKSSAVRTSVWPIFILAIT